MIISVEKAKELVDFKGWDDAKIERKLKAIEQTIRSYTNNNFQKRTHRKTADIVGGLLVFKGNEFFKVDDTIMIGESTYSEGLYVVKEVTDTSIKLDKEILDEESVLVTKVEYPDDVIDCCINILEWEVNNRSKVGIKSETLSRHSVTYEDSSAMFNGYPSWILGGLRLHKKARF